jgi:Ser/Thr protein kinase RdoA (MazF antagonist)
MSAQATAAGGNWRVVQHDESTAVLHGCYGLRSGVVERLVRDSLNSVWRVRTPDEQFVLKRIGRPAGPDWLEFQRVAMDLASSSGIPTEPLVPARDGCTSVRADGAHWQLRRYVDGRLFVDGRDEDLAAAADLMARLHDIPTSGLPPSGANPIQDMEHWLAADESAIEELGAAIITATDRDLWQRLRPAYLDAYRRARQDLDLVSYKAIPQVLTHGEYAGSNLVFDESGAIVGLLDWDGVDVRPRAYDIARGVLFLGRSGRGRFTVLHRPAVDFLVRAMAKSPASAREMSALIPILELYCVPTPRYVELLAQRSPDTVLWYLNWSALGAATVRDNLAAVVAEATGRMSGGPRR